MAKQKYNPLLESGFQEISTGGGVSGGYEPLKRNINLYPLQITRGFGSGAMAYRFGAFVVSATINQAQPFWFQQDVKVTRFRMTCNSSGTGSFVIYKYVSEVSPLNPNTLLNFSLFHQEVSSSLVSGLIEITLASPITMSAGDVYIAMFVPNASLGVSGISQTWAASATAASVFNTNKFLGGSTGMNARNTGLLVNIALSGGVAPSTTTAFCYNGQQSAREYLQIGLENA